MTKERATQILKMQTVMGDLPYAFIPKGSYSGMTTDPRGITEQEDKEIRDLWNTMPGYTCYHNALVRISKGETIPE